jgi:uncharacterized protein (DUF2141 family)
MAKLIYTLFFICLFNNAFSQTGTVIVNIQGIQLSKGGELSVGIFKKENFPKVGKQLVSIEKEVTATQMQVAFNNVPVGLYGVVVFQDIDKDKDLKTNFVGFPKEPIGFSNGAKIKLGPPSFEDAQVKVELGKTLTLSITLL